MRIFDHRKHWFFVVNTSPEECEAAFRRGLEQKIGPRASRFEFEHEDDEIGPHLVASYRGAKGWVGTVHKAIGGMSKVGSSVNAAMDGAQIAFKATPGSSPGTADCEMWLKLAGQFGYGHIAGASLWRQHMRRVEDEMKKLDRHVAVSVR